MLTSLDLFSCIGCHAIGLARANIRTIAFCESNPWRRAVLARTFPGVPTYDDVRTFGVEIGSSASIIVGGPPCQNTSKAAAIHGKRTGENLWSHMFRICDALRPAWVVVEQPPGNAAWEAEVSNDLHCAGWHVARFEFGACDVGAPYLRRRVYMVAGTSLPRLEIAWATLPSAIATVKRAAASRGDWDPDQLAALPVDARAAGEHGAERRHWIEALGDSNPPHMMEVVGRAIVAAQTP